MRRARAGILLLPILISACHSQLGPERVPTIPIAGIVLVDGEPAENVRVTFHAVSQAADETSIYTAVPKGMTDADGKFQLSTYVQGDGVAEGTYVATFQKLRFDAFRNRYTGPDQLKGKYSNPDKSTFSVTVTAGEEQVNLEPFELTLKKKDE